MSGPYNNRNRGRGGNRSSYNQNNKRRPHDYQQQVPHQQQHQQHSGSINNSQELNNGVYANERFMHTTLALIGSIAKVTVGSGKTYEGVFRTYSPKSELVLEKVHKVDPSDPGNIPFREEIQPQMVFKLGDIINVQYTNVDPYFAVVGDGFTDGAISRKTNGQAVEKELQPWVGDVTSEELGDDGDLLESGKSNGWDAMDMFRINRDKFQIESTYDPNMGQYTTPLPAHNTEDFKMYEENAAVMAREIEASLAYKQRIELENTKDEETLHSAVVREPPGGSGKNQQRQRQEGGQQYNERSGHCVPRINKSYTSSSLSSQASVRENSPISRQQSLKTASSSVQSSSDLSSTPLGNYSDVVAKKHLTGSVQSLGHQGLHPTVTASHASQSTFSSQSSTLTSSSSSGQSNAPATNLNGFKNHSIPEQASVQSNDWKDTRAHHLTTAGAGSYGGSSSHQQQSGEVGGGHHHHFQAPAYHKDVTIAEKIKDLREFQVNFNLTDIPHNLSTNQPQQLAVQNVISNIESLHVQAPASTTQTTSEGDTTPSTNTPTSSKTLATSSGLLAAEGSGIAEGNSEKKKEATFTLNPNANEFRPRNVPSVSLDSSMGQVIHPMQVIPAANLSQQQTGQIHLQTHKPAQMSSNQTQQQTPQLVPSTVASPPVLNPYPAGIQQFAVAPHPPIFYCQQPMTPRYSGGAKRATVSARGNNEGATPQATNIMAGAPLISQNGLPAHMFVTPQQMISPYNSLRLMTPCPVILEHVPHNPMLLSASMINPLAAPPHGTPTAVMHPLLQQQQILAQQPQQPSNNGGGRPNSNGSGAPTPVHYQPGHPMSQQAQTHNQVGVAHHQHQIYHGTPSASLSLQAHVPQQIPSGSQMPNSMQSQMIFSPFIPTFPGHHPQSGGFTAAMPPPAISGTLQGQVPPGTALHHHQLVQHHQFQPMIIASQNQQAGAQLGPFVAVPGLPGVPQGPPNIASPLLYGVPPTIQPSMAGQNFQHGQ